MEIRDYRARIRAALNKTDFDQRVVGEYLTDRVVAMAYDARMRESYIASAIYSRWTVDTAEPSFISLDALGENA